MKLAFKKFGWTLVAALLVTGFGAQAAGKTKAKASKAKPKQALVSTAVFKTWSKKKQANYLLRVRFALVEFERANLKFTELALNDSFWRQYAQFLPEALAEGTGSLCMVGGRQRDMVNGKCPTWGYACSGASDEGYKCGVIWGNICVDRKDGADGKGISERCEIAYANANPKPAVNYEAVKADFEEVYSNCAPENFDSKFNERSRANCEKFIKRADEIRQKPGATAAPLPSSVASAGDAENAIVVDADTRAMKLDELEAKGLITSDDPPEAPAEQTAAPAAKTAPMPMAMPDSIRELRQKTPASGGKTTPSATGCMKKYEKLGALACVACGMEESELLKAENLKGEKRDFFKWISLLGIVAQTYSQNGYNVDDKESRARYQARVMDMVATYGYCLDNEYNDGGQIEQNWGSVRNLIDGRPRLNGNPDVQTPDSKAFAAIFGIYKGNSANFSESPSRNTPMLYPNALFNNQGNGFEVEKIPSRQWRFIRRTQEHLRWNPKVPFSSCIAGIQNRMVQPHFQIQQCKKITFTQDCVRWPGERPPNSPTCQNGSVGGMQKWVQTDGNSFNEKLYDVMANKCGTSSAPNKNVQITCDYRCERTGAYPGVCEPSTPNEPREDSKDRDQDNPGENPEYQNPTRPDLPTATPENQENQNNDFSGRPEGPI